jgi:hypothetical protein
MSKIKTIASLGALPPGKRLIEYTHEYTKTYRNTYYQVVDETRAEQLESQLGTNEYCDFDDTHNDQAVWLADQHEPSYDSDETHEEFKGVELLDADIKYDPSDEDQRYAVERGWYEHNSQRDYDAVKQTQGAQG